MNTGTRVWLGATVAVAAIGAAAAYWVGRSPGAAPATAPASPEEAYGKPAITRLPAPDALRALESAESAEVSWSVGHTSVERGMVAPGQMRTLNAMVGTRQEPELGCEPCVPRLTLTYLDAAGEELGRLEAFCPRPGLEKMARFRDATSKACQTIELANPGGLRDLARRATRAGGVGGAGGSGQ